MPAELLQFPEKGRRHSPIELYRQMHPLFLFPRNTVYIGAPVSSGLAHRVVDRPAENIQQVIALNRMLMVDLVNGLSQEAPHVFSGLASSANPMVVLPHTIEDRLGDKELDINMFWIGFLTGIDPSRFAVFTQQVGAGGIVDLDVFNSHAVLRERRWNEYKRLAHAFLDFSTTFHPEEGSLNPVSAILFGPDRQRSLGCSLERLVGSLFGITQYEMQFNKKHPLFDRVLHDLIQLKEDADTRGSSLEMVLFEEEGSAELVRAMQLS